MKLRLLSFSVLALISISSCRDHLTGPPATTPTASDTIAHWTFSSNLKDVTGNGHDGTNGNMNDTVSYGPDRFGHSNSAIVLDGHSNVTIANKTDINFTGNDSYTISAWVKTTSLTDAGIITKGPADATYPGYRIGVYAGVGGSAGTIAVWITDAGNGTAHQATNRFADGYWHLITIVVTAHSSIVAYLDSAYQTTFQDAAMDPELDNIAPLLLGMNPDGKDNFIGSLDDIVFLNRALDPVEVAARFHEGGWTGGNAPSGLGLVWTNSTSGDFGTVQLNSSVVKHLDAFDNANFGCTIQSITITGSNASEFSVGALTLPAMVSPNDSIAIPVTWQPTNSTGSHTATLTVTYLGQSGTQTLTLPLNGTVAPPTPSFSQGNFGTTQSILGVCFQSVEWGYACGAGGTILRSSDSGSHWTALTSNTTENLYRVSFADVNTGLVGGNNGALLRTTDRGNTWTPISAPFQTVNGSLENIRDLKFLDATHVMMVGGAGNTQTAESDGFVMISSDAGLTWTRTKSAGITIYGIGDEASYWQDVTVVGGSGEIYSSGDGGKTWFDFSVSDAGDDFLAVDSYGNSGGGVAATAYGTIYQASGILSSWGLPVQSSVSSSLRTVKILDNGNIWIGGDNGVLLHTTNNGSNWSRADINGVSINWNEIVSRDAHTLAFVGDNGTLYWYKY